MMDTCGCKKRWKLVWAGPASQMFYSPPCPHARALGMYGSSYKIIDPKQWWIDHGLIAQQ